MATQARILPRLVLGLVMALLIGTVRAAEVSAVLDRNQVMVGESANLSIIIEGGRPQSIENFTQGSSLAFQGRGQAQQMKVINGQTTHTITLNYGVTASQPGTYTIPAIRLNVDGVTHSTRPLQLTVTPADTSVQNQYAFLRLAVQRQEVYVGEIFPAEIQLYVTNARDMQTPQLNSDGFVVHQSPEHSKSTTQIGNHMYNVLTFKKSLSAAKAGELTLGPAEMSLTLLLRSQNDPNDPFGGFFGGRFQARPMKLTSPTEKIKVLPLPPNAPPSFNGAIGQFNWMVRANATNINAGEPITLTIAVAGSGNLDSISLPSWNWDDFKAYQPNSTIDTSDPLGLRGRKNFELVVVPQHSGLDEIPELTWSFFDPIAKTYRTLTHRPIPIQVNAAEGGQPAPTVIAGKVAETGDEEIQRDIVHIKSSPGTLAAASAPLIQQPWFIALQGLPLAAMAGFTLWRRRQDSLANNPRLRRKLEVRKTVSHGMNELHSLASNNDADPFYALVFRLLQEQLGERLDLPSSAITEAVIDERLPARGAAPETIARLHHLFQVCNQARYAPTSTGQELLQVRAELETALMDLQALPD